MSRAGPNTHGQMGSQDGNTHRWFPIAVPDDITHLKQVTGGRYHTFFVFNSSLFSDKLRIYGCGSNEYGQLGLGKACSQSELTVIQLPFGLQITQINCGEFHTAALDEKGQVWGCGKNTYGQLGLGGIAHASVWTQIEWPAPITWLGCGSGYTAFVSEGLLLRAGKCANVKPTTLDAPFLTALASDTLYWPTVVHDMIDVVVHDAQFKGNTP